MEIDNLKQTIEEKALEIEKSAEHFRLDMMSLLEAAKDNEILKAINAMNNRLTAIENRLPPVEEDE